MEIEALKMSQMGSWREIPKTENIYALSSNLFTSSLNEGIQDFKEGNQYMKNYGKLTNVFLLKFTSI